MFWAGISIQVGLLAGIIESVVLLVGISSVRGRAMIRKGCDA